MSSRDKDVFPLPKGIQRTLDEVEKSFEKLSFYYEELRNHDRVKNNKLAHAARDRLEFSYLALKGKYEALKRLNPQQYKKEFEKVFAKELSTYLDLKTMYDREYQWISKEFPLSRRKLARRDTLQQLAKGGAGFKRIEKERIHGGMLLNEDESQLPNAPGGPRSPRNKH